jgi:hypothetical protein
VVETCVATSCAKLPRRVRVGGSVLPRVPWRLAAIEDECLPKSRKGQEDLRTDVDRRRRP